MELRAAKREASFKTNSDLEASHRWAVYETFRCFRPNVEPWVLTVADHWWKYQDVY